MSKNIPTEINKQICSIAGSSEKVNRVWLFGSRARGDFKARSDIDLAVEAPLMEDLEWTLFCERLDLIETLLSFDIVRFDSAADELKEKIQQERTLLYE